MKHNMMRHSVNSCMHLLLKTQYKEIIYTLMVKGFHIF